MEANTRVSRLATRLFSTRAFRPLFSYNDSSSLKFITNPLKAELGLPPNTTNIEILNKSFTYLQTSYKNEYVYKNLIASKIFVGRHRAANSTLLSEFRVGSAVADTIFLNGDATVYEIKTEMDNPGRLTSQLQQYYKSFTNVAIVASSRDTDKYMDILRESPAGLISVGPRWHLSTRKAINTFTNHLSKRTMLNSMRVPEMKNVLMHSGVSIPDVPNGYRFEAYLEASRAIPVDHFYRAFVKTMKTRRALTGDPKLLRDPNLFPLRSVLTQLDPNAAEGQNLYRWLSNKE